MPILTFLTMLGLVIALYNQDPGPLAIFMLFYPLARVIDHMFRRKL